VAEASKERKQILEKSWRNLGQWILPAMFTD
jgi:hypothetical protein